MAKGGMKLASIRLWRRKWASLRPSLRSVFFPGKLLTCCAFARITVKCSSSRLNTGFQYGPVLSMATWLHSFSSSQSRIFSSSATVVLYCLVSSVAVLLAAPKLKQHTTYFLPTSMPAHRSNTASIMVGMVPLEKRRA